MKDNKMRIFAIALMVSIAAPAMAQDAAATAAPIAATALHHGQKVKDVAGNRIGEVDKIIPAADGNVAAVRVIVGQSLVTIPASTLALKDGALTTTLTRAEAAKL
jgi:ABC-type transporter Mla subunit MlaD